MSPAEERSSSGVRNLRSLFENREASNSPDSRGRAGVIAGEEGSRRTSRVRASFVPVENPTKVTMATTEAKPAQEGATTTATSMDGLRRSSSAGQRRGSFSEGSDHGVSQAGSELKKTISEEVERRQEGEVAETIPEAAVESASGTPSTGTPQTCAASTKVAESPARTTDHEPANPDKPTTAAEEEPATLKPAEPSSEEAVSGGQALPPVSEDLRKAESKAAGDAAADIPETKALEERAKTPSKQPTPIKATDKAVDKATKAFKSVKSAVKPSAIATKSEPKSDTYPKPPTKKSSRSSLTASTAASLAKSPGIEKAASMKSPTQTKPKPRETTKPIDLPSRLTAPTAASRAKHEPAPASTIPSKPNGTAAAGSKPKPATARPTPRTSLASGQQPPLRASISGGQKPAVASESFLQRMTRPTAASANKTHEKSAEVKTSPRNSRDLPVRPKTNGHVKKPAEKTAPGTKAEEVTTKVEDTVATENTEATSKEPAAAAGKGDATPLGLVNGDQDAVAPVLEATPASGDEEIR